MDDTRAIDQLLVAGAARSIVTGERCFCHSSREILADNFSFKVGIQTNDAGIALVLDLGPFAQDLLHRANCQHVVGIDAGVQFRVDIGVGRIVSRVHSAIFLVDILNLKSVVAALPITH